ncbi:MAG: hypothetical protein DMF84_26715 [Acidobacteria bacterium]|nr:MAG: hypothetical protein DMF84_26715 [Acidobacteriota bacterium]
MTLGVLLTSLVPSTRQLFAFLVVLGTLPRVAHSDPIVNTGPGPSLLGGFTLNPTQWLAGAFTVDKAHIVTSVEGWVFASNAGDVTVRLYSDGGDIPGTSLFADTVRVESPDQSPDWTGATNLNWLINPGTYWAALEVPSGEHAFRGGMTFPSPNPLRDEAAFSPAVGHYESTDHIDVGWRILGDPVAANPTPEPSTLALLSAAVSGVAGRAWRRRRQRR